MRKQLQTFTNFANTLLPHELTYLLSVQQLEDDARLDILRRVDYNAHHIDQFTPYDTELDKRKYNHLQNWIQGRLSAVDVDEQFSWMHHLEQQLMSDSIQADEERELLKAIRHYAHPVFNFSKFYELVQHYRHFLLIRLRYVDHQRTDEFLLQYRDAYHLARAVSETLHAATVDIVGHYSGHHTGSEQWESWLSEVFYNEQLEGHLRYLALVRLAFIGHNRRKYDLLRDKFAYLDQQFAQGRFYSKRLLLNYYNSRLMLHSNAREYDQAVYYGYLSVRAKTHDHLLYVNNLCAVLLRLGRYTEALQVMKNAAADAKQTSNFHNRVGYVAFYMEALNRNGLHTRAVGYGDSFLKAYTREILQYRWHLFFSVYLEALLHLGQYEKLLKIARKHKLAERDLAYRSSAGYIPTLPLYLASARYHEGELLSQDWLAVLDEQLAPYLHAPESYPTLKKLLGELKEWLPGLASRIAQREEQLSKSLPLS